MGQGRVYGSGWGCCTNRKKSGGELSGGMRWHTRGVNEWGCCSNGWAGGRDRCLIKPVEE